MLFLTQSNNAYDVGGTEPLCIRTLLPRNTEGVDSSLSYLFDTTNATQPQLVPSCPSFLQTVDFTHLFDIDHDDALHDEDEINNRIYQGDQSVYPFELSWFDAVPPNLNLVNISARLMFCDAEWGDASLCHPLVDVRDWNKYHDDHDDSQDQDDDVRIIPTIPRSPRLVTTPWFPLSQNPTTVNFRLQEGISKGLYYLVMHYAVLLEEYDDNNNNNNSATSTEAATPVRWDVATLWSQGPLYVESNPTIMEISDTAIGFLFLASVATGTYALFCTIYCWRHRDHVVMSLAQAPFLILLSASCLGLFALQFLLLPTLDWHCRAAPVVLGTFDVLVVIILNARLWRAYQTLSAAGQLGMRQHLEDQDEASKSCCRRFFCCCCRCCSRFHWGDKIITLFTFLSALPFRLTGQKGNGHESTLRRAVTNSETASLVAVLMVPQLIAAVLGAVFEDLKVILEFDEQENTGRYVCDHRSGAKTFANTYYFFLCVSVLILSWMSRNLPSAFNEKNQMFQSTGLVIVISIVAAAIAGDVDQPTSPPAELLGVEASAYICSNLLILVFIVQPKINLVWSGKKIVVSKLLRSSQTESEVSETNVTGGRDSLNGSQVHSLPRVVLRISDPFPRRAEVCMYSMLDVLRSVTQRSSKGRPIRKSDWKDLCDETARLSVWTDRIVLDWDNEPMSNNVIPICPDDEEASPQVEENVSLSENTVPNEGPVGLPSCCETDMAKLESDLRERLEKENAGARSNNDTSQ